MNMSIYFPQKTILNKIPYSFSMTGRINKSDIQSILLAVTAIIFLGVINHQNYEYSCYIESPSQTSKKISLLLFKKNLIIQNLRHQNPEHAERRELMKLQIETALFSQESQ